MDMKLLKTFYCGFCRKHYHREDACLKHEQYCVWNPDRKCYTCDLIRDHARAIFKADPPKDWDDITFRVSCPMCQISYACIYSVSIPEDFKLKDEMDEYHQRQEYAALMQE